MPNQVSPGIGTPRTNRTNPVITPSTSTNMSIQRNMGLPSEDNNGGGPPNLGSYPAQPAVVPELGPGRRRHHSDGQDPEGPGGRDVAHQPGEVHSEKTGEQGQRQEEGGEHGEPGDPQVEPDGHGGEVDVQ